MSSAKLPKAVSADSTAQEQAAACRMESLEPRLLLSVGFLPRQTYGTGQWPNAVTTADFNGDGKADLAVLLSHGTDVFLGNGDGTFQNRVNYDTGTFGRDLTAGDFNGDGNADLAAASDTAVNVVLGNGDGSFQSLQAYPVGRFNSVNRRITTGDFNGDGAADLAVASGDGDKGVSILLGDGDGTFQGQQTYNTSRSALALTTGDFNDDDVVDLAICGWGDVGIMLSNGDGSFQDDVSYNAGDAPKSVTSADLNADGYLDLVVTNPWVNTASVLLGNGDGSFQARQPYAVGASPDDVTVTDFNGDGTPDLAVANNTTVSVLLGNGNGTFQAQQAFSSGSAYSTTSADFNGDGAPDLAVVNYNERDGWLNVLVQAGPSVSGVSSTANNGAYKADAVIPIIVTLADSVMVDTTGGTPSLALNDGGTAYYAAGSGTATLTFDYTVAAGQNTADLDYASTSALSLNGGTIRAGSGVAAALTLSSPGSAGSLGANKNLAIDTTAPAADSVSSTAGNGAYMAGEVIPITVHFPENVTMDTSGGTPSLALNNGATALYASGSGTGTLTFHYTVSAGQDVADLDYSSTDALSLGGGAIRDAAGNDAELTLASPGAAGSLGANRNIAIDTTAPAAGSVSSPADDGAYKAGAVLPITIAFDEAVTVDTGGGTPSLACDNGGTAVYAGGSGTGTLTFHYRVGAGQDTTDLDYSSTGALSLNGGTIRDAAGNDAELTLSSPGAGGSLGADGNIEIDTVAPAAGAVDSTADDGTYKAGAVLTVTIAFDEHVTVNRGGGTPSLALSGGGTAVYVGGSGSDTLTFHYTVAAGQNTADLDYSSAAALSLNGGTIQDAAGNDAELALASPGSAGSLGTNADIVIDTTAPTVTVDPRLTNDATPSLTGTVDDPGATVSVTVDGHAYPAINNRHGTWTLADDTVAALADATYDVSVTGTDAVGNVGDDAGADELTIDTVAPTVTVNRTDDQADPAIASPVHFAVVFSEPVTGFGSDDVTLAGTAGATTAVVTGSGTTYNVAVSGMTGSGTVVLRLAAGAAGDSVGNASEASSSTDTSVSYEVPVPIRSGGTRYRDADGNLVTVVLTGGGTGNLYFAHEGPCDVDRIILADTTARSVLTVRVAGRGHSTRIGNIETPGSLRGIYAGASNLAGGISIGGSLRYLLLHSVTASTITIDDGGDSTHRRASLTADLGVVEGLSLDSREAIRSLTAESWTRGEKEIVDAITAPSLGVLVVHGDCDAALTLDGGSARNATLGRVRIGGDVNAPRVGSAPEGSLNPLLRVTWQIDGHIGRISIAGAVNGLEIEGLSDGGLLGINSMRLGDVQSALVFTAGYIDRIRAEDWLAGSIEAASIGQLRTSGDFSGTLEAGFIRSMTIQGDLRDAQVTLARAVDGDDAGTLALGKLAVNGWIDSTQLRSSGNIRTVIAGGLMDSLLLASVKDSVTALPTSRTDFVDDDSLLASILAIRITGIASEPADSHWMENTVVAAWNLGAVSVANVDTDNGGQTFGLAGDSLRTYTRVHGSRASVWSRGDSAWPDDSRGDYVVQKV